MYWLLQIANTSQISPSADPTFRHEFGHTLQSRMIGPLYISQVGVFSLIGAGLDYGLKLSDHDREWYETQANRMSERYFQKQDPGALVALPWDDIDNPRTYNPDWYWLVSQPPFFLMWWLFQ